MCVNVVSFCHLLHSISCITDDIVKLNGLNFTYTGTNTRRRELKNLDTAHFFNQLQIKVSGNRIHHSFECLIPASQIVNNSWRNSKESSPSFMIINIPLPNLLLGSDFLRFLLMKCFKFAC